jgi:spore germination protein YaaH
MKRLGLIWGMILFAVVIAVWMSRSDSLPKPLPIGAIPTFIPPSATSQSHLSLFVPYWSLTSNDTFPDTYTTLLYFGVSADENGLQTSDQGYVSLPEFAGEVNKKQQSLLVVRLLDNDANTKILDSTQSQQKIISQTITLAQRHHFNGIVTDLELRALPFNSLVDKINSFNDSFSQQVKQAGLQYGMTMYGDVFYRVRPFDMTHLSKDVDMMYVLAYDLHKTNGSPGPNFPIAVTDSGDYDLSNMIQDYMNVIPADKITVVFGMFGYDWQVDDKGQTVGNATAITNQTLQQKFLNQGCLYQQCTHYWDAASGELVEHYIDNNGQSHIIWSGDLHSTTLKKKTLQKLGISNFSYWAYGYF